MKIYLDDMRECPEGFILAKTALEAIELLKNNQVEEISLDHDLGDDKNLGTGYDVVKWIEEQVAVNNYIPPKIIKVHSANISARTKMELGIQNIFKIYNQSQIW